MIAIKLNCVNLNVDHAVHAFESHVEPASYLQFCQVFVAIDLDRPRDGIIKVPGLLA